MEERKSPSTFYKVTALLCALVMLFGLIAFFSGDLTARTKYLNNQIDNKEQQIEQTEKRIGQMEEEVAKYQREKQEKETELNSIKEEQKEAIAEVERKRQALQDAEDALDAVCSRSYYSAYSCSSKCRSLHTAVSNRERELNTAKNALGDYEGIEDEIKELTQKIEQTQKNIQSAQNELKERNEELKELKKELTGARFVVFFKVLAMLLALGGLGLLAKNFYEDTQEKYTLYAVAGLAASSLLFLIMNAVGNYMFKNSPILYLLLSPNVWNLAVMALFAKVLLKKAEKPVHVRNAAIVLTVIVGVLTIVNGAPIVGALYAAAMICTAFVIEPLVFTEYIDIAKHIFLSIITFGIWQLVWIYHVTKNLNNVAAVEERRPARELLLSMFLVLYYPYWLYKTAEGVEDYGKEKDKAFKIDVLCIAFSFVCPLFATVLIQNKINVIVGKPAFEELVTVEISE